MKNRYFYLFAALFLLLVRTAPCDLSKTQALSSLIFYLQESVEEREEVLFTPRDIDHLWERILVQEDEDFFYARPLRALVAQATQCVAQGQREKAAPLFRSAALYLTVNWLYLNGEDPIAFLEERCKQEGWGAREEAQIVSLSQELLQRGKVRLSQLSYAPSQIEQESLSLFPELSASDREEIFPYLLPANHVIKPALDAIFHSQRATHDDVSLKAAGFLIRSSQPRSFIRVASHPNIPYFLFKIYLDADPRMKQGVPGWRWLVRRCEGAEKVRKAIAEHKSLFFTAPHKWIYPLPLIPKASGRNPQPVILVVEDMRLVSRAQNLQAWKTQITPQHLDELYRIISQAHGSSYRPDNIHQTIYGNFAFIDTEYPHHKPNYGGVRSYLNKEMRHYWDVLIKTGGESASSGCCARS